MTKARFKILVIPLPALLGRPGTDELRDPDPVVGTLSLDQLQARPIFILRPRSSFGAHGDGYKVADTLNIG